MKGWENVVISQTQVYNLNFQKATKIRQEKSIPELKNSPKINLFTEKKIRIAFALTNSIQLHSKKKNETITVLLLFSISLAKS